MLGFLTGIVGLAARMSLTLEVMHRTGASGNLGASYGSIGRGIATILSGTCQRIMRPDRAFGPVIVDTVEVAGLLSRCCGYTRA